MIEKFSITLSDDCQQTEKCNRERSERKSQEAVALKIKKGG